MKQNWILVYIFEKHVLVIDAHKGEGGGGVGLGQGFPTFFKLRNTLDKKKVLRNTYSNQ